MDHENIEILDYLIVLCPEINPNDKGVFSNYKNGLYLGGEIRMKSAVKAYKKNKELKFILVADYNGVNGGKYNKSQRTDDMINYLIKLGVPSNLIEVVNSLPCTRHNLVAVFNNFKDIFKNKKVGILTNLYHMPRTLLFWIELKKNKKYKNIPDLPIEIIAEDIILSKVGQKENKKYIKRLELEMKGIIDLSLGKYRDACIKIKADNNILIRNEYKRITKEKKEVLLTPNELKSF